MSGTGQDPSQVLALAAVEHCDNLARTSASTTFAFEPNFQVIQRLVAAAFDLSIETYEGRPITGGLLLVDKVAQFFEQIPSWQFAGLAEEPSDLSFGAIKNVAAAMDKDTGLVVGSGGEAFVIHGLLRQRFQPLRWSQRGETRFQGYEWLPLVVSIEAPGTVAVAIGQRIIGVRRGDQVWTSTLPLAAPIWITLGGYTQRWGDPGSTAAFLGGVVSELAERGVGGTVVVGPRIDLADKTLVQPGAVAIDGLNLVRSIVQPFEAWLAARTRSNERRVEDVLRRYQEHEKLSRAQQELSDLLVSMASTDGAVLIDPDGNVYAYHAYFAVSGSQRAAGEGSRHGAIREFMSRTEAWFALVVSQDGVFTLLSRDWGGKQDVVEDRSIHGVLLPRPRA